MSDRPFVPFYTSDFLAGTSGMTAATKGVYITLLSLMYEAEAPLPQSWETLARRSGCTMPSFKKAIEALEDDAKITITDAGIWSEKCDKHITQRRERSDSAKAAAKKRWEKDKEKQRNSDATASSAQCKPEPYPEPKVKRDTNVSPKKPAWPDFVSPEVAKGYEQHRIAKKAKLTPRAITLLSKTLHQIRDAGMDPNAALDLAIERGWQGLKFEWVQRELSTPTNGASHERPRTAYESAKADNSHVASAWIAEGRRRDEERSSGEGHTGDPGGSRMDCRSDGDAVVPLFRPGAGPERIGGGGFGLDEHSQPLSAGGHRNGV